MKINHFFNAPVFTNEGPQPYSLMLHKGNQVIYQDHLENTRWTVYELKLGSDISFT
jgi:hypothetical protein